MPGRRTSLIAVSLILWVRTAAAQISTATLVGTVKDSTGAVVAGAIDDAKNLATGAVRSTTTDGSGEYALPNRTAARYAVTVTTPRFTTFPAPPIELQIAQRALRDAALEVGVVGQTLRLSQS